MLTGDGEELLIELKGNLNRLYHLDSECGGKKESNHTFYTATQHHICGVDSFMPIIQSLDVPEYYIGFREYKTPGVFKQVKEDLAGLGVIFFCGTAERPDGVETQEAWGPL